MQIHTIDLHFQEVADTIAVYLIEHNERYILVETGPYSSYEMLLAGLEALDVELGDIDHLLITHVHFDHAGAAWAIAKQSGAQVHVHPLGQKHLANPERLWNSAVQIYGEAGMSSLWGKMENVPNAQLRTWNHEATDTLCDLEVTAIHTPGHAKHHIAWQVEGHLFLGDVGGVQIADGPIEPPCPPPDIDVEAWQHSINLVRAAATPDSRAFITHFGEIPDLTLHLKVLEDKLLRWAKFVHDELQIDASAGEAKFVKYVEAEREDSALRYSLANPAFISWPGLVRYWNKREGIA